MRRRLGFAVVVIAVAFLAAAAWRISRLNGSGDWPRVRPLWPPAEVSAAALTVPPPPPPPACPCIDAYDYEPLNEDDEATEAPPTFRLSDADGNDEPERASAGAAAKILPLSGVEAERLLASLPPLPSEPVTESATVTDGAGASAPPPGDRVGPLRLAGEPVRPPAEPRGPLTVIRSSPRGEVTVAPQLAAVFSEPMAPLGATAPETPPVRLVPEVPGQWRWVGSRLLLFLPESRFPMATEFVAQVREGTRALSGARVEGTVEWRFSTPAPSLIEHQPTVGPIRRDAVFFLAFDQAVDPAAVLASVRVEAAGTRRRLRPATGEEIRRDPSVRHLAHGAVEGRWVAFRAVDLLPGHSLVRVTVGPGVPSREGPRRGTARERWSVETYGPLTVREASCDYQGSRQGCAAGAPWSIELSNPLDRSSFREAMVRIEPPLDGASVKARGSFICIRGLPRPRTKYRVSVDGAVRDEYGGRLGHDRSVSFEIGEFGPALVGPGTDHLVLDPASDPAVTVYSAAIRKLRVQLRAVQPADWPRYRGHQWGEGMLPGRLVLDRVERPRSPDGSLVATRIPLGPALRSGTGQMIVTATSSDQDLHPRVVTWVQVTRIGVDASWDGRHVLVRTTSLADGAPLRGVSVRVNGASRRFETNGDGVADVPVTSFESLFVEARLGDDAAFLAVPFAGPYGRQHEETRLRLHVIDDRGLYRPGEDVHLKGWVREVAGYPVRRVAPARLDSLGYRLVDARASEVATGTVPLTRYGSFETVLKLPKTMALGGASLQLRAPEAAEGGPPVHVHFFRVDEYRRPEVELKLRVDAGPLFPDRPVHVTASARTFDGTPLDGAAMQWWATSVPSAFSPPQWTGFSFAPIVSGAERRPARSEGWTGPTDARGVHAVAISALPQHRPYPRQIQLTATAHDVNRQTVSASTSLVVHPAALYVGIRAGRAFVSPGDPFGLSFVVTDLEGHAVAGRRVRVSLVRVPDASGSHEPRRDEQVADRRLTSSDHPVTLRLASLPTGHYRATATVADDEGRTTEADTEAWVGELGVFSPAQDDGESEGLRLVADRSEYGPGDLARLEVLAPFASGEGLLTIRHAGVVVSRHFRAGPSGTTLAFRLSPDWLPGVRVQVDLSGPGRQFASGHLDIPVSADERRLRVTVAPREASLEPRGRTVIRLGVADVAGAPVGNAELTCVVVDEAVLAVLGHDFGNPLHTFFARATPVVTYRSSRSDIRSGEVSPRDAALLVGLSMGVEGGVPGGIVGGVLGGAGELLLRSDMHPLALFAGSLVTDGSGRAEVPVSLPDSVTRFRVFAVASDGGARFGTAESSIVTRLPLVLSPSPPRFLRPGDAADVSVVVQNDTGAPLAVDVGMRATLVRLPAGAGAHVDLPPYGRAEARFPVVASRAGNARFQVVARAGEARDATAFSVPVREAAVTESAAVYGEVAERPAVQAVEIPPHAIAGSAELEVTTSATEFAALQDATVSLVTYPYECGEQIASRVLALTTLGERIARLGIDSLDPFALRSTVQRDLLRLSTLQQPDGGFSFWSRGASAPEVTVHVAHALATARATHGTLAQPMLDRVLPYLRSIETKVPLDDGEVVRRTIGAEALYVRGLLGEKDPVRARQVIRWAANEAPPPEAAAWLLAALAEDAESRAEVAKLRAALEARVTETGSVAHVVTGYEDRERRVLLASEERTDAVVLDALLRAAPESDLIPKLTAGLLAARRKGRWSTTQANAWAIVALDHAFRSREATPPDFTATAWLGERTLSAATFRGFDGRSRTTTVRLPSSGSGPSDVTLAREGRGVLHYRLGLRYRIDSALSPPVDRGLIVEREFEALENSADVRRSADGTWHIRAGARVRVRVVVVAPVRRSHVALVSPFPAGIEPLNPSFRNAPPPRLPRGAWAWWDRVEIRDDRVQLFASSLPEGIWTFTGEAVATTPGRFLADPPKVEEMYSDDVFGRGTADRVVID